MYLQISLAHYYYEQNGDYLYKIEVRTKSKCFSRNAFNASFVFLEIITFFKLLPSMAAKYSILIFQNLLTLFQMFNFCKKIEQKRCCLC